MQIFDAHIRSDSQSDDDLRNLAYFDTRRVVTTAHGARNFEKAEEVLDYFGWLIDDERARIIDCGLEAAVGLGMTPEAVPSRRHPEVWSALPKWLARPEVAAVGEIGVWEDETSQWELFERQVEMARDAALPVIATPPSGLKANMTYKMMMRAEDVGAEPERILMTRLDERLVDRVVRDGFVAGLAVGSSYLEPKKAAEVVAKTIEQVGHAEQIVLTTALSAGASDVLGIAKTIEALRAEGVGEDAIERVVWSNAAELFGDEPFDEEN